jgi:hypothetical protein
MSLFRAKLVFFLLAIVTLTIGDSVSLYGQGGVGQVVGTLSDPSGAVVVGASITARHATTGVQTEIRSNADGAYRFPNLPIGVYTVTVRADGFKTLERSALRVVSGETQTLDLRLELGQTTQIVKVSAAAAAVESTTSQAGTTRVTEEISELPLLDVGSSRNVTSLLRTLPGVDVTPGLQYDAGHGMLHWPYGGVTTATINGGFQGSTSYSIDGVMASAGSAEQLRDDFSPPPEMIDELRLNATNTPEYGWNGGVGVTIVEKSGTNQIHGSAFEYVRNDALDARTWSAADVSVEKQNEWGFVVGGPVVLPHLYNGRNKTFFLATYGGYRYRTAPGGGIQTVPTASMRTGDFSELLGALQGTDVLGRPIYANELYDPSTTRPDGEGGVIRDPFMYQGGMNVIDPARLSSVSKVFQAGVPLPTRSGTLYNYVGTMHESFLDNNKYSFKIDENVGTRHRFSFAYEHWGQNNFTGGNPFDQVIAGDTQTLSHAYHYRFVYTGTLSSNLVYSFRTGVNRMIENDSEPTAALNGGVTAGLRGLPANKTPYIYFGACCLQEGYSGWGHNAEVSMEPLWTVPINTDLTWIKGTHSLKFGGQYMNNNEYYLYGDRAGYSFLKNETGLPANNATTGWDYASFLVGSVDSLGVHMNAPAKYQDQAFSFYGQDSWRITRKLTLNYGLRWDIFIPPHEGHDRIGVFDPTIPNTGAGGILGALTFFGDGAGRDGRHTISDTYFGIKSLSPSLGFAYALNPKTAIRGSWGLSSLNAESAWVTFNQIPNTGWGAFVTKQSLDQGVTPLISNWDQGGAPDGFIPRLPSLDPTLLNGGQILYFSHNLRPGRTENINFGVERELPGGIFVKAAYVGNLTHGIPGAWWTNEMDPKYLSLGALLNQDANSPEAQAAGIKIPYAGFSGPVSQALMAYPQYPGAVRIAGNVWFSEYNSAQFTVQKRTGHGLSLLASYTISKNLSDTAGSSWDPNQAFGIADGPAVGQQDWHHFEKHVTTDDRPQMLYLSWVYELPFGPGKRFATSSNPVVKQLVGGWRVSGVQQYTSGVPVQIVGGTSLPGLLGGWGSYAKQVPGVPRRTPGVSCGNYDPNNPSLNHYINPAAFTNTAPFTLGDISTIDDLRQCGYKGESVSVQKVFPIRERLHLLVSGDFNNVFNRHNWSAWGWGTGSALGIYSHVSDPRLVQLHMKLEW